MGSPADNPLNFYSVILSGDVHETGLMLPEKFTAKHGGKMKSVVALKLPDGCTWQIDLDDDFWLRNGWSDFAEHYGLCFGDFLVFKYQGNSIFHVIICDRTASEIEYPEPEEIPVNRKPPATSSRRSKKAKTVSISSEVEEIGDDDDEDRRGSPEKYSRRREKGKSVLISSDEEEEEEEDEEDDETFSNLFMEETEDEAESRSEGKPRRRGKKRSKIIDKSRAFESASAFQSDYPFFLASMTNNYITGRRGLLIHETFIDKYWHNFKKNKMCVLQLSNGETWGSIEALSYSLPTSGWRRFIDDNSVKEGDVCVCELIDRKRNVLKVHIFREDASENESPVNDSFPGRNHHWSNKGASSSKARVSVKLEENAVSSSCMEQQGWSYDVGKRIAFESAKAFKSDNPTFVLSMTPYNMKRGLIIPYNVLDREWSEFRRSGECVIQLSNGETWGSIDSNTCSLSDSGWRKFVKDNCIKNGDACVFELIDNEQCLLRIHIFRSVSRQLN